MRVADLIKLLEAHQAEHGPDSQIAVPAYGKDGICGCREETYIDMGSFWTVLTSRGPEVEW